MTDSSRSLANEAWQALLSAHATVLRELAASDIWTEVSLREYDVLYTLATCADAASQGELEQHVLLSQPAISRLVDRLVERGLVSRTVDPADRRRKLLALTDAGRALQRRVGARHARDVVRAVGARLDREEMASLTALGHALAAPAPAPAPASAT